MPDEVVDVSGITLGAVRLKCYGTPTQVEIRFEPRLLRKKQESLTWGFLESTDLAVNAASHGSGRICGPSHCERVAAYWAMVRGEIAITINPRRAGYRQSYAVAACNAVREALLSIINSTDS